jgi:hypothetical protein
LHEIQIVDLVTHVTQEDKEESRELVGREEDDTSREEDTEVDKVEEATEEKEEDSNSKAKDGGTMIGMSEWHLG